MIERDNRSPPRGCFSTSELQMHKYQPHLRILVVVCRWFRFRFVPRGLLRIRATRESVRRHVAMEINARSSDFLVGLTCVACVSSPESLR